MKKIVLKIGGMSCSACQNKLEKDLNNNTGIKASVNLITSQALIEYDEEKIGPLDIDKIIKESGYQNLGIYNERKEEKQEENTKIQLIILGILLIIIIFLPKRVFSSLKLYNLVLFLLTIPFIIFSLDIIKNGLINLKRKNPNMNSLVSIGVLSSFIYSIIKLILMLLNYNINNLYFESSAMIIFFIKIGRYIDNKSKSKTTDAIKELVTITPEKALLKTNKEVTIDEVKKGDILICKPGMKIAVDGTITKGKTHLDESLITGESYSKSKTKNDKVIAGSINLDGYIEYKAEQIGPESTISEIVRLVTEATNTKARVQRITDKACSYFVPTILTIAIVTLLTYLISGHTIDESITTFVTILLVSCPCALGLATPLALITSEYRCTKTGILIKTSKVLEILPKIDTIIFDKTGTLTNNNLTITKINNYTNLEEEELIRIVASLEQKSNHPISKAFKNYIENIELYNIEEFKEIKGIGLSGIIKQEKIYLGNNKIISRLKIKNPYKQEEINLSKEGNSIIYVIKNKEIISLIGVKDTIRENIKEVISSLQTRRKKIIMLTGDNEETAKIIAKQIGISEVIANYLPKQKENYIKYLKNNNHKVMMIGDGINDAPSLATADIGVSLNTGTDIAANSADIILMNENLNNLPELFNIGKQTIRIIKQNLFWAFFYNLSMLPLAIGVLKPLGLTLKPVYASIAMVLSSLTVITNSLRLRK